MTVKKEEFENGQVKISDDVIGIISGIAATEVDGVNSMHTGFVEGFSNLFSKNNYSKGIKVDITNDNVIVDIFVNIDYGFKISKVALEVQKKVKSEVETMTDLNVIKVNVHVQNIITEKETTDKKDSHKED